MDIINYNSILQNYPWIIEQNKKCILSPDSDGFMCALLLTNLLNWKVVGFYDGKIMAIEDGNNPKDCIFLDMDVNRSNIRSVGHHMVKFNKRLNVPNFNYQNCIQPNNLRNFDGKQDFQKKYPFGTIHLLYGIMQAKGLIDLIPENATIPLLFVDGVFNNLLGYTENCLEWINYLGFNNESHILFPLFFHKNKNLYQIMTGLNDFFRTRDSFNARGYYSGITFIEGGRNMRTGHQLKLSNPRGEMINLESQGNDLFKIHSPEKARVENFVSMMGEYTHLTYNANKWTWDNLRITFFTKKILGGGGSYGNLTNASYQNMMMENPFSSAMTSSAQIEYAVV